MEVLIRQHYRRILPSPSSSSSYEVDSSSDVKDDPSTAPYATRRYSSEAKKQENDFDLHCKSKKHQLNEQVAREQEAAQRKIFVTGFDKAKDAQQLLSTYFSRFGKIKNIVLKGKHGSGFAFVEFKEPEGVKQTVSQRHHKFNGFSLYAKKFVYQPPKWESKRVLREQHEKEERKKMTETHNEMMDVLMSVENLSGQISLVAERLKLSPEDKKMRDEICSDLTRILSPYFENCTVYQFGSSVNGFGAKGCDLDLFLDLHDQSSSNAEAKRKAKVQLPFHKDIPSLRMHDQGPLTVEHLKNIELYDVVKLLSRLLTTKSGNYTETLTIPSQRCPVVKFTHKPTGIKCDLSLNNKKALHNSYLLRLFGSEPRVHRLVSVVRLWARSHDLSGSGGAAHLFTSYAISLIVMFYIMQRKPRLIPLVCDVINCVKGASKEILDDWECVSLPPDAVLPTSENKETDEDLLKGFFEFCGNSINWDTDALVTRNATVILRGQISRDPAFMGCKAGCLTVLDPFVLTHNVAGNVNEKTKAKFVTELKRAAQITSHWHTCDQELKSKPWGVAALLVPSEPPKPKKSSESPGEGGKKRRGKSKGQDEAEGQTAAKSQPARVDGEQDNGEFVIALSPLSSTLCCEKLTAQAQENQTDPERLWCSVAQDMVLDVFQSVFMVHVEKVDEEEVDDKSIVETNRSGRKAIEESSENIFQRDGSKKHGDQKLMIDAKGDSKENSCNAVLVTPGQSEVASGKRTSHAAQLDSSSSESLETSAMEINEVISVKDKNPKKKLRGGIDQSDAVIDRISCSDKITGADGCDIASENDSEVGEGVGNIDSCQRKVDDDGKEEDDTEENDGSSGENSNEMVVSSSDGIGKGLNSSTDRLDKEIQTSEHSLSASQTSPSSSSAIYATPGENESPGNTETAAGPSPMCGDMPVVRVFKKSSYCCSCQHQLWLGRKILRSRVPSPWKLTGLEYEKEISKLILKEAEKIKEKAKAESQGKGKDSASKVENNAVGQGQTDDTVLEGNAVLSEEKSESGKVDSQAQKNDDDSRETDIKCPQTGKESLKKGDKGEEIRRDNFNIEFTCEILHQYHIASDLPYIFIKMQPTAVSINSFKNLYCSFRSMILRLVKSGLFDQ